MKHLHKTLTVALLVLIAGASAFSAINVTALKRGVVIDKLTEALQSEPRWFASYLVANLETTTVGRNLLGEMADDWQGQKRLREFQDADLSGIESSGFIVLTATGAAALSEPAFGDIFSSTDLQNFVGSAR